jgi:hypothetical protein
MAGFWGASGIGLVSIDSLQHGVPQDRVEKRLMCRGEGRSFFGGARSLQSSPGSTRD